MSNCSMSDWLDKLRAFGIIDQSQKHWTLGKYYGYPTCCIKNFVNMNLLGLACCYWMNMNLGDGWDEKPTTGRVKCVICRTTEKK